jgi:hypothetical protein
MTDQYDQDFDILFGNNSIQHLTNLFIEEQMMNITETKFEEQVRIEKRKADEDIFSGFCKLAKTDNYNTRSIDPKVLLVKDFVCWGCNKILTTKRGFKYHINKKVCVGKYM